MKYWNACHGFAIDKDTAGFADCMKVQIMRMNAKQRANCCANWGAGSKNKSANSGPPVGGYGNGPGRCASNAAPRNPKHTTPQTERRPHHEIL